MKPEPLKGKKHTYICPLTGKTGWKFFEAVEIKSAVEFLRKELCSCCKSKDCNCEKEKCEKCDAIDWAFEDVIENGKKS